MQMCILAFFLYDNDGLFLVHIIEKQDYLIEHINTENDVIFIMKARRIFE